MIGMPKTFGINLWRGISILIGIGIVIFGISYGELIGAVLAIAGGLWCGIFISTIQQNIAASNFNAEELARYKALEAEHRVTIALAQLTQIINVTLEPTQVFSFSLEHLAQVIPYDSATIFLAEDNNLEIAAHQGKASLDNLIGKTFEISESDIEYQVMNYQKALVLPNAQNTADWYNEGNTTMQTAHAWIGAPLVARGQSIGLLTLSKTEPGFYKNSDKEVVSSFAAQIATAVQNARLFDSLRHQALEMAVMADNMNEEKSKLDTIIRHIADGLVVTDAGGTIQMVNPAFEEIFSQPTARFGDGGPLGQIEELQRLISSALSDDERNSIVDFTLSNGRILKASSAAIQEDTRKLGVVTVLRDITREKEVDRMKSEFISTVSHELRTPLTSVLGFAQHISKIFDRNIIPKIEEDDKKGQRAIRHINEELDIIMAEGERLTRLINDVLDIAKMEAGKLEWQMSNISIEDVIRSAVASTSSLGRAKNLPIVVNIEENISPVWADYDRLIQVVTNLLSNAFKFTDEGQITVSAETINVSGDFSFDSDQAPSLKSGNWLLVSVQDTGIGIADEHIPYIFEKFKQVGNVLTDRPAGTGLGVPICKEIVDQHDGHIWIESELEVGTTFLFVLPLSSNSEPQPILQPEPQIEVNNQPVDIFDDREPGQRILVVDDEANIRSLLCNELNEAGYQVIEATDGLEALDRARQEKPDLIILDVMMPGLNGFDVTSVLKGDQSTVDIPILILSIVEDKEKGFRLGAEAYLTKPLDTEKLLNSIARLLHNHNDTEDGQRKVLVIDKSASVVEIIGNMLIENGYGIVDVSDEDHGLDKARQEKHDLIILNTPQPEDYDVLQQLKHELETTNTPIVVLTNTITPEEMTELVSRRIEDT